MDESKLRLFNNYSGLFIYFADQGFLDHLEFFNGAAHERILSAIRLRLLQQEYFAVVNQQ